MTSEPTVVTACDHKFVWGALLLGISMRFHDMQCAYNIVGYDLLEHDLDCLQSIPGTKVFPAHKSDTRSVCTQKPMAINTADSDIVGWMDADCVVSGNLEKFFVCPQNRIQIRQRELPENQSVFRNYYGNVDIPGEIPQKVLDVWQRDVADLPDSRIKTVYQTNCFVINRGHLPFIELWKQQMMKVIPPDTIGVYSKDSVAYSMTDESVINSLFAFSSHAPRTAEYLMDKDPKAMCIHFGLTPKPWEHWTLPALKHYGYIQMLILWAKKQGIKLPPLPYSLRIRNRKRETFTALAGDSWKTLRFKTSNSLRSILRRIKS